MTPRIYIYIYYIYIQCVIANHETPARSHLGAKLITYLLNQMDLWCLTLVCQGRREDIHRCDKITGAF